jgi:hypothetical protein
MNIRTTCLAAVVIVALAASPAFAQAVVTVDRNVGAAATHAFKFAHVPSPSGDDAGTKAKLKIVDGDRDMNGYTVEALNDGLLPRDEDEPGANFFFDAGTGGGRLSIDLGSAAAIAQVNTYSWHPNTRGPQIYTLYAADGKAANFNPAPKNGVDPTTCGWTKITSVDTTPKNPSADMGGQYGVSITDSKGSIGTFRFLLFEVAVTETFDDYGNTFYSEIDVVTKTTSSGHLAIGSSGHLRASARSTKHSARSTGTKARST